MASNGKRQEEIGRLDRRIVIQRNLKTIDTSGQRVSSWVTYKTVWAGWYPTQVGSDERFESEIKTPIQEGYFKIRYDKINTGYRIVFDGLNWDIKSVQQDGRKRFLKVYVESRDVIT